mmetsp:Transcript_698/g.564  ORF Transcript_698/g.564 Transcript_698/m.564 type:complete len:98 (+) Transcript_698:388-681(+)
MSPVEVLKLSLSRFAFTLAGALIMLLSSGFIFPNYAMDDLVTLSADAITQVSKRTSSELQDVISWANEQIDNLRAYSGQLTDKRYHYELAVELRRLQ